ncbi:MAG: VCBS repeat-containing protein [Planctomycetia bacterium]|nr:VCBS repeat-containing protein [Planctomycetia bacterium]
MRFSWLQSLRNLRLRPSTVRRRNRNNNVQVELLEQRQVLTMLAPVTYEIGATAYGVEVGDFNNDGVNDIAELSSNNTA